jgi:cell division ATPase FtsA
LFEKSFSIGGGYITAKLLDDFKLPFSAAEKLKRMVNISYNPYEDAHYELEDGVKVYSIPVSKVNASVKEVLDAVAEQVAVCIEEGVVNYNGNIVISLTGGGISYIRGAKEYLSKRLGAIIQIVTPNVPLYNKPINSSTCSLLDIALKKN